MSSTVKDFTLIKTKCNRFVNGEHLGMDMISKSSWD
jgi:hypothetical protein